MAAGRCIPCQCTPDASSRALRTRTFTRSPRFARRVGPRWSPLNPHVGVAAPSRNSVLPACIRRSKTRVPSSSTVEGASGGTASSLPKRTLPTVLRSALVHHHANEPPIPAASTPTTTVSVISTRFSRRRPLVFPMLVSISSRPCPGHGADP
ncbi:hypothetical protein SBADM41S_02100 [Streptomyces badius]